LEYFSALIRFDLCYFRQKKSSDRKGDLEFVVRTRGCLWSTDSN